MPIVERSIEIMASPRTVWELLSTPEGLRTWWAPSLEIEMKLGGTHRHFVEGANQWISGCVLEIEPERRLVLSWYEDGSSWVHPTRLTFTLEAIPGGTRVTQRYDGFAGIGTPTWERTMEAYRIGLERFSTLPQLKTVAEQNSAA